MFIQIDVDGTMHTFPLATVIMEESGSGTWTEPDTYFVNKHKVDEHIFRDIMGMIKARGLRTF